MLQWRLEGGSIVQHIREYIPYYPRIDDIISFLMVSSIFTSFTGVMMLYFSFLILGVTLKPILLCAMFFVIYSVYSLNRLTDQEEDAVNMPARSLFVQGNERFLLTLAIVSYVAALFLGWLESPLAAIILLVPFMSGILYSKHLFSAIGIPRLKDIFLVKSFIVASSWTICASFLPALYLHNFVKLWFVFPFFFIKIFINTILFDVRDVEGDMLNNVKTVPVVIGIARTRQLLLIIQSMLVMWSIFFLDLFSGYYSILTINMVYGYLYILYFCNDNHRKISRDILVDGEWVIMSIWVWIYFGIDSCFKMFA